MTEAENFIDELLAEVEAAEESQQNATLDFALIDIRELTKRIEDTFAQAEAEKRLIDDWALRRASKAQDRIDFLAKKLEIIIVERAVKTIDLPNCTLKLRKKQDKIEIENMDVFLQNATPGMLNVIPEAAKPDIAGIKSYIKMTGGKLPAGVKVIPGTEEFSYKLKGEENGATDET